MSNGRGGCLCGAVTFSLAWPSKWVAHCHCSMCRRAHGAAFVTWVGIESGQFTLDDPEGLVRWYTSSPGAERGFCSRCGSSMLFRSERWPGEMHVVVANLDEGADRAPMAHVFWDTHVDWADVDPGDGLPRKPASSST